MKENLFISYNARIYPASEPVFPLNRAMSYGDGLFESIRIHNGEILFFEDHIERLFAGMKALKIDVPEHFSLFFFHKQLVDLAQKEQTGGNARVRITVFRSGGGLYQPLLLQPEFFLEVVPLEHGFEWSNKACELGVFREIPKDYSTISFFKSINALPYVMASLFRKEQNLDDCLLLNSFGKVADAVSSNIFWIAKDIIYTTPLTDGGVAGVLRKQLIRIFKEQHLSFQEASILPDELLEMDELFITNVGWGIKPITKFGDKIFTSNQTKEVFRMLYNSLSE
ncbi:MAG: aminotransferase class IV [Chitinophagales bacterium]